MGNAQSSSEEKNKSVVPKETYKSPRNVLENIGKIIKDKASNDAKQHEYSLKGDLTEATFRDAHFRLGSKQKYIYSNPCYLDHRWYTNLGNKWIDERDPCYGRYKHRFDEDELSECSSAYIRSDGNNSNVTACAPPRRRHMCDKNLEALNEKNTQNVHDLLGNVLVTAKYEGDYIVKNHPNKGTSEVCIALARSFADIGDIVRGKDMFKPNKEDEVWKSLRSVFRKIYEGLDKAQKDHYKDVDGSGNYYKLREAWWNVNRDKVWEAITCNAPYKAWYSMQPEESKQLFSDLKCGHEQGNVPTNLDYVPQFLRWFDEWAEEFCRKRKIKLEMIKDACYDRENRIYCSHNGYDCTQMSWKKNIESRETYCTGCFSACSLYDIWLRNRRKEFEKQKMKYENEIQTYSLNEAKSGNNINNEYYKDFYSKHKENYEKIERFLNLLNEGKYCKEGLPGEEVINFNNTDEKETLYRSQYCKVCPYCGLDCDGNTCTPKPEIYTNCIYNGTYNPPKDMRPTEINVIDSGNEVDISKKLKDFCTNPTNPNDKIYQKWKCYYTNSDNINCQMTSSSQNDKKYSIVMTFYNFFDLWVKNLLRDSIKWETELKDCINNTNVTDCNNVCNENCVCFEKWVNEKEREWNSIKELIKKEQDGLEKYYININKNFDIFFFRVMYELNKEEKWNEFMKNLRTKIDSSKAKRGSKDSEGAIKVLFDHLKEITEKCIDNNSKESCESYVNRTSNPCAKTPDNKPTKSVKQLAQDMQQKTQKLLGTRGGESKLKGDATRGEYDRKGSQDGFKDVCSIGANHSNSERGQSEGPCDRKDEKKKMFDMEFPWMTDNIISENHKEDYIPPRRRHFCTSNLENLETTSEGLKGANASHSLLGDVLLAAKYEADFIKTKYEGQKGFDDEATMCRAMKYSFADLADIIKGTDLWDKNPGEIKTQERFKTIFGTLYESLGDMKNKYDGDKNNTPPYKKLREDWWEANRHQVWRAMKCATKDIKNPKCNGIPIEDYIPQKLRWLIEWAEWYCKVQSQAYKELKDGCGVCMDKEKGKKCTKDTPECKKCKKAGDTYKEKLDLWRQQWVTISDKYEQLYKQAHITAINGGPGTSHGDIKDEDKSVVNFLLELYLQNGGKIGDPRTGDTIPPPNTPYCTTAGYIHQELPNMGCISQTQFCKKKNGEIPSSGTATDKEYAFRDTPPEFDDALGCVDRSEQQVPTKVAKKEVVDVCKEVVGEHFSKYKKVQKGKNEIDGCNPKGNGNTWDCSNQIHDSHKGACMPPRRQSLCIHNLTFNGETSKENGLRDAFIRCSAKEVHFLWEKYKEKNGDADEHLQKGKIPDEFKRIMYYTYGDYRDFLFGTDISKENDDMRKIKNNIRSSLQKIKNVNDDQKRKDFWDTNGPKIWEGMICALTHDITEKKTKTQIKNNYSYDKLKKFTKGKHSLEDFAKKPQFLRWYIEWSEEFCRERNKKEGNVSGACSDANFYEGCEEKNNGGNCANACEGYKKYIDQKKVEYTSQAGKFNREKKKKPGYEGYNENEPSEYLEKECLHDTCSCMDNVKKIKDYWEKPHTTYENTTLQTKCECKPPPSACEIVDSILGDKSSRGYKEGCKHKYGNGMYNGWDCGNNGGEKGNHEEGDVCIPPRRKRLYIKNLQDLKYKSSQDELRTAFIECAAVENFFSWHEFKKEKEREDIEKKGQYDVGYISKVPKNMDKELERGIIHEEFKRQMFYTFADYRDIFFGNYTGSDVVTVKQKIDSIFPKNAKRPSEKTQEGWWNEYGQHIWEGMLCALSYNTETKIKDESVSKKLNESSNKYDKVTFKGGFNGGTTTLTDFVKRPPYFRWLEEWSEEFCKQRTEKLTQIKVDCRGHEEKNVEKYCDEDGFDCIKMVPNENAIFEDFTCQGCAISCKFYKKWINRKREEFKKQSEKYETKIKNVDTNNYDKEFYKTVQKQYPTVSSFIESLKDGQCNNNTKDGIINFKNPNDTFGPAKNCAACPILGVKCNKGDCGGAKEIECKDKKLTIEDIKKMTNRIEQVNMLVSDNSPNKFPHYLDPCRDKSIFEGIRDHKWSCGYVCNLDICEPKSDKGNIDDQQYVPIRVLFKRWVEFFLKDYNKINDKILHCMNNGEQSKCINGCKNKCDCVDKWINQKSKEWTNVRDRYFHQYNIDAAHKSFTVKSFLESLQPETEVQKAIKPSKSLNQLQDSCESNGTVASGKEKRKYNDVVECLLDKLKNKIDTCKKIHNTNGKPCSGILPQNDDTPNDDLPLSTLDGIAPTFCNVPPNPCSDKDATNVVNVEEVAENIQGNAHTEMIRRSVVDKGTKGINGESVLKGNISQAKFKNGDSPSPLNEKDICKINTSHSNDRRGSKDGGPCTGKDGSGERMKIGTAWKTNGQLEIKDNYLFLPPRREHICTSNLEKIDVNSVIGYNNVNASFLVDVLLAAKMDAETIKQKYKSQNNKNSISDENDKEIICRAIKYSFADIGDIIRGKDLWENNDFKKLEEYLVTIFGNIKKEINGKLNDIYDNDPKHTKLRFDWWEANRDQIWNAMKCQTTIPLVTTSCDTTTVTPLVDYIPQRLRWMTEWSEWYCKIQKKEYKELEDGCKNCKNKGGKCMKGDNMCNTCKTACDEYNRKIEQWRKQWEKMEEKYNDLYTQASTNSSTTAGATVSSKDETDVVAFLSKLHLANKGNNTIYSTAAGYIHQEGKYIDCKTQTQFCHKKNDETSSTGKDNDKYTFKKPPPEYQQACNCNTRKPVPRPPPPPPLPPPPPFWKKNACQIAHEIFIDKNEKSEINGCYPKNNDNRYPEWKCDKSSNLVTEDGICMPPRRQQICLKNLETFTDHTSVGLRKAFIECASTETFLLWQKYKQDKQKEKTTYGTVISSRPDVQLKHGTIPEDFKRQMFYTYADYRDICLGSVISNDVGTVNLKINSVFSNFRTFYRGIIRKKWWEIHGPQIWKGMLCALQKAGGKDIIKSTYNYNNVKFSDKTTNLETFSSRPPFLRWMTEWGDQFCHKQSQIYNDLKKKCTQCEFDIHFGKGSVTCTKCDDCKEKCKAYNDFIDTWEKQWTKQKNKYAELYQKIFEKNGTLSVYGKDVVTYLSKLRTESGANDKYSTAGKYINEKGYIEDCKQSKQKDFHDSAKNNDDYAFREYPHKYNTECTCEPPPLPPKPKEVPPALPSDEPRIPINDILLTTIPVGIALALGSIAFLFIKKKPKSPVDLLRVLDIHKGDYGTPTPKSSNRYIPYVSDTYKGKTYIYMEGDTSGDEKYAFMSDTTDITSSESEYEEMDINDIYVPESPKYKTLIEVVLEPSKSNGNTLGDDMVPTTNTFTDEEWNELKHDFISQYIQSEPLDVPQYDVSTELPMNITEGNVLDDGINEKPFITSIHDRDLYTGEEISYNIHMSTNIMDDPKHVSNNVYSGIDLINDTLSGNAHIDIYDEVLKRKENELFGTNYKKNISNNSVAKLTNSDPIMNQLDLLHKWLDRHRDMCEKWNTKEDILNKLNEQWNKDNAVGNIQPSNGNKMLYTDVSIEIDMDETKGKKEFTNMDTNVDTSTMDSILDDLEAYNEPFYDIYEDDVYYDVNDDNKTSTDHNNLDVSSKVQIEMDVNSKLVKEKYPITDVWDI
ncbi:erythrocyte membrane protein 1, PfEMP1, putative [Plasmodium sp.]|nr:erythrocyte membrane protein 1, PfEMP1, putative [Plasmodium sp.]